MKIVPFDALPADRSSFIDLHVDAVYEGGTGTSGGGDPIARLLPGIGIQGGFRSSGKGPDKRLVVLYTSGADLDWPDTIDHELGKFTYFGDNKTPGHELHDTHLKGNEILRRVFDCIHSRPAKRPQIPPFLVFRKHPTDKSSRSIQFKGLAVPGYEGEPSTEDLVALWKSNGTYRFQNYKATFTLLDIPVVSAEWIKAVMKDDAAMINQLQPRPWQVWRDKGIYLPLKAEPARRIRTQTEQEPANEAQWTILLIVHEWFSESPHAFEAFAAYVFSLQDERVRIDEVTRPSVDGGRDALGSYRLGLLSDPVLVDFALEAKCYRPRKGNKPAITVGVSEVARLISRIRHRQFGVLVTTSVVARQAYEEVRADDHPIVIISGRDIAETLIDRGFQSVELVHNLLTQKFPVASRVTGADPVA